ncbi:hypothetical protein QUA08_13125 [Microcoleus sp. T3B2]|uniref:hypothetical protein n=1 Tax=Microcoleus sp. T3B2 TaxID=3055426 RepID=UPI002FD663C4
MTYREPIVQNPRIEIAIGIGTSSRESDTSLLGKDFPLSPEADNRGRNRVAVLRLFQDFTQRGEMSWRREGSSVREWQHLALR